MANRAPAPSLPGFKAEAWLGGGGFADVYRYTDTTMGREVAIKVLHRGVKADAQKSFEAEANLMAKLSNHPSIVSIFQAGVAEDGRPFLVMEICPPPHLGAKISKRPLALDKTLEIGVQISGAVETAHRLGILHRDIKPANILFTEFGRAALTDFGISVSSGSETANSGLSPLWAPPEQFKRAYGEMGPASDVFSLASTLWACLVGRSPMSVAGQNDHAHLRERVPTMPPPRTGRADVPDTLEQVLAIAMSKAPSQRYQTVLEFARALQGVQAQLNHAVTNIDVLTERSDEAVEDEDLQGSGTRIGDFHLIDPDAALTDRVTGPSGGITTPLDDSRTDLGIADDEWRRVPANVAQHGRGVLQPGIRDFTGPAIPDAPVDATVSEQAMGKPAASGPSKKTSLALVLGLVVALLLALGAGWVLLNNQNEQATSEVSPTAQVPKPQEPMATHVPPVKNLKAELVDGKVLVTWSNPVPQDGDLYLYQVIDPTTETAVETIEETEVTVQKLDPTTCVEVMLRRANGRVSEPERACTP